MKNHKVTRALVSSGLIASTVTSCALPDSVLRLLMAPEPLGSPTAAAGDAPIAGGRLQTGPYVQEFVPLFRDSQKILQDRLAQPVFSPDGSRFAVALPTRVLAIGGGDGRLFYGGSGVPATTLEASAGAQPWWAPDGRQLGIAEETGVDDRGLPLYRLVVVDIAGGQKTTIASVAGMGPWMAFSPDGKSVLYRTHLREESVGQQVMARVFHQRIGEGTPTALADVYASWMSQPSAFWVPDGRQVVMRTPAVGFDFATESLVLVDLETGTSRFLRRVSRYFPPFVLVFDDLTISSDGTGVAYLQPGWGTGGPPSEFQEGEVYYGFHRISLADGSDAVTPFSTGRAWHPAPGSTAYPGASRLSPDLKWCIVGGEGLPAARELSTGRLVPLADRSVEVLQWTADSTAVMVRTNSETEGVHFYRLQVVR